MPRIKPLTGNVLVELDPPLNFADLGELLMLPHYTPSAEENQVAARAPVKPPGEIATVLEIGPWPKTKSGLARMPGFGVGARVVIPHGAGIHMKLFRDRLRMLRQDEVVAVLT